MPPLVHASILPCHRPVDPAFPPLHDTAGAKTVRLRLPYLTRADMLEKPIFVIGAGRSGSSIFHQTFTEHPRVAWMSVLCDRHPENLGWHRALMRGIELPLLGGLLKRRYESAECYEFWDRYFRGFSRPCRDLCVDDATPAASQALRDAAAGLVTTRRPRLLAKITGWPRLGFLHAVFPDARFIHVVRDGRAFANSLLQVDFWLGWRGPEQWRWGPLDDALRREWEAHDRSFIALAAIQWKILMRAMDAAKAAIPASSLLEVRYEDFAADPVAAFGPVLDFCGLERDRDFEHALSTYRVESANYKWQHDLSPTQQGVLLEVLGDDLKKYGYG